MTLTDAQHSELRILAINPVQSVGRSRVQNTLVEKGLAVFVAVPDGGGTWCRITLEGRDVLSAHNTASRADRRRAVTEERDAYRSALADFVATTHKVRLPEAAYRARGKAVLVLRGATATPKGSVAE